MDSSETETEYIIHGYEIRLPKKDGMVVVIEATTYDNIRDAL